MPRAHIPAIAAMAAWAAAGLACRSGPPPPIDPALTERLPADATVLAGVNLSRLRASPLGTRLPPAVQTFLDAWREADTALIATDGAHFLALTRGSFSQPPAGATLIAKGLAAAGSADWVKQAAAGRRGSTSPPLLARAEPLVAAGDIWIVAAGNANLPLTGNGENFARLLHQTDYATLQIRLGDTIAIVAAGMCRRADTAQHLEEAVRALLTLGAAEMKGSPETAELLRRIRLSRQDREVRLTLAARPEELSQSVSALTR